MHHDPIQALYLLKLAQTRELDQAEAQMVTWTPSTTRSAKS
jgi:hypothetical protein